MTEKTGDESLEGQGSVVWVSYCARLYRCAPEQLRLCTAREEEVARELGRGLDPDRPP